METEIAAAEGPSRLSKHLMTALPIKLTSNPRIEQADVIVLLDTNTIHQLSDFEERVKAAHSPIIVVDHHADHPDTKKLATISASDENASSTCELVYRFFMDMNVQFTQDEAAALFLGIAYDTRHFILANSTTLKIVADLIDAGVHAQEILSLLSLPMKESERVARLKASKRVRLRKVKGWIVALSNVGAYQASAARALVSLGAHVAIVIGQRNEKLSISMRASQEFYKKTKIHLGRDLAKPLGDQFGGMGGGHTISAGANCIGNIETCMRRSLELLQDKLRASS
jgi:nanoRNase/pAp phosphatase (c-di-AMP/oligoRNAs hydrolase)